MSRLLPSAAAAAIVALSTPATAQFAGRKIIIDPGHGGTDPGAVGSDGGAYPNEEDFVLDTALRLRTRLAAAGADVILTRESDTAVSLTTRRDLANTEDPDLFLSIHCNSFSDASANGTETFWWTSGNAADQALAGHVQSRMMQAFSLRDRGVKQAAFTVITASPPAALAEMMFISNPAEFALMNTPAVREAAADAFYRAAADFLGIDLDRPLLTAQPASLTRSPGTSATFTAAASGSGLSWQWRRDGVPLTNGGRFSGVASPTLAISGVQLADAGFYSVRVSNASGNVLSADAQLVVSAPLAPAGIGAGLRGTYFDNPDFTALRRARLDPAIDFNWGAGSPSSTMQPDNFSVRWTGEIEPRVSQLHTFHLRSDDGARLRIGGSVIIDRWNASPGETSGTVALTAGQRVPVVLEYREASGDALCELRWSAPSLLREIVPASQLHRPPPVVAPPPPLFVLAGTPLTAPLTLSGADPILTSQPFADFEGSDAGAGVMFRAPSFSSTTAGSVAAGSTAAVSDAPPSGNASARSLRAAWSFAESATAPWLRLTTFNAGALPNPLVDFTRTLRFDAWSARPLRLGLGLRETGGAGPIGSDGGTVGPIEFVGVTAMEGSRPLPLRTLTAGTWQTLEFHLPSDPAQPFTGNGTLPAAGGLGVLEHLAVVADDIGPHELHLDNFVVVEPNRFTWSLVNPPARAAIDPASGLVTWTPQAGDAGPLTLTVRVSDAGTPAVAASGSIDVVVVPPPRIVSAAADGAFVTMTWTAAAGARYRVETSGSPEGPWSVLSEVTAAGPQHSLSAARSGARRFWRVRAMVP